MKDKCNAVIIGAGFTGCALAYDLAQRGFNVAVIERGDIGNGTSGRTHGLLHSGGRYCVTDHEAAVECIEENITLRKIAKQCIEFNGGLFVALDESDVEYGQEFARGAESSGIPIEFHDNKQLLALEPQLNPAIICGYSVPDGAFDPLRLALAFAASAVKFGAKFYTYHEVTGFDIDGQRELSGIQTVDRHTGQRITFPGDITINATGAWAGKIAALAEIKVPIAPTPGVMVAYDQRVSQRVINRLCKPDDGDIIIPQRRMAVIGTTSFEVLEVDYIPVTDDQVQLMHQRAAELIPALKNAGVRGTYMSARPLIGGLMSGRSLSRTFKCFDHAESDGLTGFVTITGGKATTCRVMAQKTADLVCLKAGISEKCRTSDLQLADYHQFYAQN